MICDVAVSIFSAALFLKSLAGCRLALELTKLTVILREAPKDYDCSYSTRAQPAVSFGILEISCTLTLICSLPMTAECLYQRSVLDVYF